MLKNAFFGRKDILKELKTEIDKTVVKPSLIYDSASWTVTETHKSRITALEMR